MNDHREKMLNYLATACGHLQQLSHSYESGASMESVLLRLSAIQGILKKAHREVLLQRLDDLMRAPHPREPEIRKLLRELAKGARRS